jgi:hypothetical protein
MVRILSTFGAISFSLAVSLFLTAPTVVEGHGHPHGFGSLEKRAAPSPTRAGAPQPTSTCKTAYAPIPAGGYPAMDCVPFIQDPQVQAWLKLVDFTKTPVYQPSANGVCPPNLSSIPKEQCWWTCQKCEAPTDITSCPTTGTWGLTYDGKMFQKKRVQNEKEGRKEKRRARSIILTQQQQQQQQQQTTKVYL